MDIDDPTPLPAPAGWLEALAESDADVAAGRVADLSEVLAEMEEEYQALVKRIADARTGAS